MPAPNPYAPRNIWKARVAVEGDSVVKDYAGNPLIPRLLGRVLLKWEAQALERLHGLEGIPDYRGRPTRDSLRMSLVPGLPIDKLKRGELGEVFYRRLAALFEAMHARGVAHGDAHQRNILVHEERPYLVDFATAYVRGRFRLFDATLFHWICLLDRERLYKVERKFLGTGAPPQMFLLYRLIKGKR